MADSFTVHRRYTKPEDGASADTWGVKLNGDFDAIDGDVYSLLTDANYADDSGTANVLVIAPTPAQTAYVEGLAVRVKVAVTNTGSATLNVNGLGAKNVLANDGSNLTAGTLQIGGVYTFIYDGTQFKLQGVVMATAAQALDGTDAGKALSPAAFFGNASLGANGYYKLPGGLVMQWGFQSSSTAEGNVSVTFPTPFVTACDSLQATLHNPGSNANVNHVAYVANLTTTGATVFVHAVRDSTAHPDGFHWIAFGR